MLWQSWKEARCKGGLSELKQTLLISTKHFALPWRQKKPSSRSSASDHFFKKKSSAELLLLYLQ